MAIGDHLFIQYPTFTHHGIDLGDDTVAEYTGKTTGRGFVRQVSIELFIARGRCFVCQYLPGTTLPPEETVRRARDRLGECAYDLFNNNCEHFAYWCKTGHHWSPQANSLKGALAIGAFVGFAALIANAAG